jgi:predicted phage tail protein
MIIEGAKGKGDSSSPEEASNTLRSTSIINIVGALGEGEIEGLVNGDRSLFFDGTPLMNIDGSLNRQGVSWTQRLGLPDQDPVFTNARAGTPHTVEQEVKNGTGRVIRTVTETNAADVMVVVRIDALAQTNTDTGDVTGASVQYVVERRAAGGDWEIIDNVGIFNQKCMSPYFKKSVIPRPDGNEVWDIAVRRLTPDSDSLTLQNNTVFDNYITRVKGRYSYGDTALIAMRIDSQTFGSSLGAITAHVRGLKIAVPSNYDPITRAYTGVWDGTFVKRWTNNPAWVFWDLLTNTRYGLGEFVDPTLADKWSLYQIARYCDQMVPSGFKTTTGADIMEPRFTFNGVINSREEAYKVLQNITTSFRGMAYWSLSQVFVSCDMPSDPVVALSPANVVGGAFNYSGTAVKARHSVALCTWNDPQDHYKTAIEVVQDDDQMQKFGWRQTDVTLVGCTSRGQAHRFGSWILDTEKSETETVQFTMSWDGYVLENNLTLQPGNIILISDPRKNGGFRSGGRFAATVSASEFVLDAPFEPQSGQTYTIGSLLPSGKYETRPIVSFGGDDKTITVSPAFSEKPVDGADWIIQGTNMAARRYRVMAVQETDTNLFKITALFNDPTKYARVEQNINIEPIPYVRPRDIISQVTNIKANEARYFQNGVSHSRVTLSWTAPNDFLVKDFTITADSPRGFANLGSSVVPSIDITDAAPGEWTFYISARSMTGAVSVPVSFVFTVEGWEAVDGPIPSNLRTSDGGNEFHGRAATMLWDNVFPPSAVTYAVENVVRVYSASNQLLRTETVRQPNYNYDLERNLNDGGPRRSFRVDVSAKSVTGTESQVASLTVSNPVPAKVVPTLKGGIGFIEVSYAPNDNDFAGALIWASTNPTYVPVLSEALYDGPDTTVTLNLAAGNWFIFIAVYDTFGKEGLLVSSPVSLAINDLQGTLSAVLPALIEAKGGVTTDDIEGIGDQIAGMLAQMIADRDDNDELHKRSHQELAVRTSDLTAIVARETTARIEGDFAEATARELLQVTINTQVIAAIAEEKLVRASADEALTSSLTLQTSRIDTTQASIATEATTRATQTSALAAQYSTLSTTVGQNTASISTLVTSVDGVKVQFGVIGTIDGVTGGFIMTGVKSLDGTVSFAMQIRGDLIVDGTIGASKMNVINLAALSANLGTVTAGIIQSTDGLSVWNLNAGYFLISQP